MVKSQVKPLVKPPTLFKLYMGVGDHIIPSSQLSQELGANSNEHASPSHDSL